MKKSHPEWAHLTRGNLYRMVELACLQRDEARAVAIQAVAAVKAYAEKLNAEPTDHTFDEVIEAWPKLGGPSERKRTIEG